MEEVFLVYMVLSQLTYIKVEGFLLGYKSPSLFNEH